MTQQQLEPFQGSFQTTEKSGTRTAAAGTQSWCIWMSAVLLQTLLQSAHDDEDDLETAASQTTKACRTCFDPCAMPFTQHLH